MMIISWLSVLAAFLVVGGVLRFLAYCGKVIDADEKKMEERVRRTLGIRPRLFPEARRKHSQAHERQLQGAERG